MCLTALAMAAKGAMGGGAALSISGALKQGREEKRQAYFMAEEELKEAAFIESMGLYKQGRIAKEAGEAAGAARAIVAKAGVLPTGSAGQFIGKAKADVLEEQKLIGMETMFRSDLAKRKAKEWRRSGKEAMRARKMQAWATALGAGFDIAKFQYMEHKYGKEAALFGT